MTFVPWFFVLAALGMVLWAIWDPPPKKCLTCGSTALDVGRHYGGWVYRCRSCVLNKGG